MWLCTSLKNATVAIFGSAYFISTEPGITIPFWILTPQKKGPYQLAIMPHGHTHFGADQYVGIAKDQAGLEVIEVEERDVAVQAVQRGYLTLAPVTRGFLPVTIPDPTDRHGGSCCRSQLIHALLAGRTALGERTWDLMRLLDWACQLENVDPERILVLGNSGGCVLTALLAACDTRVAVSVMNCCFCTFIGATGGVHLCECNTVPGVMEYGDFPDIAGLIAPRPLLVVNGVADVHPLPEVAAAVAALEQIYKVSGGAENLSHIYADGGCRFYKKLMWPFIERSFAKITPVGRDSSVPSPIRVTLRIIDSRNVREICELSVAPEQSVFVASNAVSIAQASVCANTWCRAIYADEKPVGLLMVAEEELGRYYLWRFMIAANQQRRGFGGQAIEALIDELGSRPGARDIYLTYVPLVGSGRAFYIAHGFQDTGESRGTDRILRRLL